MPQLYQNGSFVYEEGRNMSCVPFFVIVGSYN
jgi:hypothetical protein